MIVHKYIKKGLNHPNYCEDFILHEDSGEKYELFGVFDGCSSGVDSHFASAFVAKIVKAEFHKYDFKLELSLHRFMAELLYNTIKTLNKLLQDIYLNQNELLTTIILFLYDKKMDSGLIISIGDGLVSINGNLTSINQNNIPDYLAYYLDELKNKEDFNEWYPKHVKEFYIDNLKDVGISTDGLESFIKDVKVQENEDDINPVDYVFKDEFLIKNKAMIGRKCNLLERKYGLINADDLGIIRIVK